MDGAYNIHLHVQVNVYFLSRVPDAWHLYLRRSIRLDYDCKL